MEENNAVLGGVPGEVGHHGVHKRTLSRGMTIKRGAKGGSRGGRTRLNSVNSVKFEVWCELSPRFECVSEWQSRSFVWP